jgi:hypothetical protein
MVGMHILQCIVTTDGTAIATAPAGRNQTVEDRLNCVSFIGGVKPTTESRPTTLQGTLSCTGAIGRVHDRVAEREAAVRMPA